MKNNENFVHKPVLRVRDLKKRYGDFAAVDGVSFEIAEGECFGMLGPNGAGKTTTVKMLHGASPLTGGSIHVAGMEIRERPREIRAALGICPQDDNLDPDFNVRGNLTVYARYFDIPGAEAEARADELLEFFQLTEKRQAAIPTLSGGMKRRLVLARALMNKPKLLLLDEPTTGLDPAARRVVWDALDALRKRGLSILLTTHYMEEATKLCDRLAVMDKGRIILEGKPREMVTREIGSHVIEIAEASAAAQAFAAEAFPTRQLVRGRLYVFSRDGETDLRRLAAAFALDTLDYTLRHASLDDVFLKFTGHDLRE